MTSSLGGFPEIHPPLRDAPASTSRRTVAYPVAGLPGLLAAAHGGRASSAVAWQPVVAGIDVWLLLSSSSRTTSAFPEKAALCRGSLT